MERYATVNIKNHFENLQVNATVTISLPVSANYRRLVVSLKGVDEEHIYRVCNGKNKKTCGYWENIKGS